LRNEQRWEARHRLAEAERIIAALEGGLGTNAEACEAALALLGGAVAMVQRRVVGRAEPEPTRRVAQP
jgi:hypothetical protein